VGGNGHSQPLLGGDAVSFAWDFASLPQVGVAKAMGPKTEDTSDADLELALFAPENKTRGGVRALGDSSSGFKAAALKTPMLFVEAVLAPLILSEFDLKEEDNESASELGLLEAEVLIAAREAVSDADVQRELKLAETNDEVIDVLCDATLARLHVARSSSAERPGVRAMGARFDRFKDKVKELFDRAKGAPARVATVPVSEALRYGVNANVGQFLGDVFVYLNKRGDASAPGPIIEKIVSALTVAKKDPDEPRIAITHSMGGNVLYDILTYYRPDIALDVWISVGGQVGFFEEMKLFRVSDIGVRAPHKVQSLRPPLKFWLNIYDPADIFSYKVSPVFAANDRDVLYRTGSSMPSAHSAYFMRPSFYDLLLKELKSAPI
jgi:hypothetical protein